MNEQERSLAAQLRESLSRLVFLAFNSRAVALDRDTGEVVWQWKASKGTSEYVALLLDNDRLIVSVQGYTYCLNPLNGEEIWLNPLKGFGYGIPTLVSVNGSSTGGAAAELIRQQEAARAASTSTSTTQS